MKYAFIQRHRRVWPISVQCRVLRVSVAGYHEHLTVAKPNQVWVGDLTYIPTDEGWLFLAVVIDLFNRQVVGWSLGEDMRCELVIDAFEMAWFSRCPGRKTGLIFHSDRGSQYASQTFQELLGGRGIKASMSRKGNC